jgi:hypothetical protein
VPAEPLPPQSGFVTVNVVTVPATEDELRREAGTAFWYLIGMIILILSLSWGAAFYFRFLPLVALSSSLTVVATVTGYVFRAHFTKNLYLLTQFPYHFLPLSLRRRWPRRPATPLPGEQASPLQPLRYGLFSFLGTAVVVAMAIVIGKPAERPASPQLLPRDAFIDWRSLHPFAKVAHVGREYRAWCRKDETFPHHYELWRSKELCGLCDEVSVWSDPTPPVDGTVTLDTCDCPTVTVFFDESNALSSLSITGQCTVKNSGPGWAFLDQGVNGYLTPLRFVSEKDGVSLQTRAIGTGDDDDLKTQALMGELFPPGKTAEHIEEIYDGDRLPSWFPAVAAGGKAVHLAGMVKGRVSTLEGTPVEIIRRKVDCQASVQWQLDRTGRLAQQQSALLIIGAALSMEQP